MADVGNDDGFTLDTPRSDGRFGCAGAALAAAAFLLATPVLRESAEKASSSSEDDSSSTGAPLRRIMVVL